MIALGISVMCTGGALGALSIVSMGLDRHKMGARLATASVALLLVSAAIMVAVEAQG